MQFYFSYPLSETQSYYLLQDCLFSLYYQLYFLRLQCDWEYKEGNGWGWCKYGDKVKCTDCVSWICPVGNKKSHGDDKGSDSSSNQCGKPGKASPLQAFLTDCLKGFTCPVLVDGTSGKEKYQKNLKKLRENSTQGQPVDIKKSYALYTGAYPEFLEHRGHTLSVFGTECAVPMGFSGSFRLGGPASGQPGQAAAGQGNGMIGLGINAVLYYYASSDMSTSSLYQLTRCICSLTRRVPRSTGTLYGFFQGIGAMCNGGGGGKVKDALETELSCCPGWRKPEDLMGAVGKWKSSGHKDKKCECLDSLSGCEGSNQKGQTCGYYLRPLMGFLYNCLAPEFCETYVSWIVHLTGVLKEGLESLLEEFRNIDCQKSGCTGKDGQQPCKCPSEGCKPSTHGIPGTGGTNKDGCCCPSVADCVGVHGLFYRFGFSYKFAFYLAGKNGKDNYKRECSKFVDRLKTVIGGEYYKALQTQLRKFLYTTRALFGVYITLYWTAVLGYLVYSMTLNLDILHIQSHWRSPGSYLVPLQRILADGSRNVKRVCTIGYFQENTGDRLLSQGVSDVYL